MSEFEEAKAFLQKDESGTNLVGGCDAGVWWVQRTGGLVGWRSGGLAGWRSGKVVTGRLTDV